MGMGDNWKRKDLVIILCMIGFLALVALLFGPIIMFRVSAVGLAIYGAFMAWRGLNIYANPKERVTEKDGERKVWTVDDDKSFGVTNMVAGIICIILAYILYFYVEKGILLL